MDVWTVCEQWQGKLNRNSLGIISEGRRLADMFSGASCGILMAGHPRGLADEISDLGVDRFYLLANDLFDMDNIETCTLALTDLIQKEKPGLVLFGATRTGKELSARVAFRLGLPCISDCVIIRKDKTGDLVFTRNLFDKRLYCTVKGIGKTTRIASVVPEEAEIKTCSKLRPTEFVEIATKIQAENIQARSLEYIKGDPRYVDLQEAEVIVAAGRGMGSKENLKDLYEFADLIGANVAGTRAAVDEGWIPFDKLVGQTGKTVRPRIYIACGISGAIQHQMGMNNSDTVIAINSDPKAPIFNMADYGIVGDLFEVIPQLKEKLKVH
jgi:electron transfer flavoprotein alpha subunit